MNMSGDPFSLPATISGFPADDPSANPNPKPTSTSTSGAKKRRNLAGAPDPDAEVIALSPKSLMATNRFICEICNKGFQREQNLQLHRRGHNLPWKLKQRSNKDVIRKKVYVCPEKTCVHHDPARALGDLTGVKKHYSRKHGEKKWKCEKCSKKYAVQSDWKAHSKTCGTREYKCDCGTLFSRRDSFITHRAFCDALAEENARFSAVAPPNIHFRSDASLPPGLPQGFGNRGAHDIAGISQLGSMLRPDSGGMVNLAGSSLGAVQQPKSSMLSLWLNQTSPHFAGPGELQPSSNLFGPSSSSALPLPDMLQMSSPSNFFSSSPIPSFGGYNQFLSANLSLSSLKEEAGNKANLSDQAPSLATYGDCPSTQLKADMSATALLQKAAQLGSSRSNRSPMFGNMFGAMMSNSSTYQQIPPPHLGPIPENNFGGGGSQPNNLCSTTRPASSGGGLDQATHHHMKLMNQSGGGGGGGSSSSATMDHHNSLTRDFLGVSGAAGQPFSPQDLAKLASMSSAMGDLSQLDGNNQ